MTNEEFVKACQDIKHPARQAYIEYVKECRIYGCNALTFLQWVREEYES